ncbi:hypothetical protein N4P33_29365 [Streptomyces sp. 15-116A]|uniref:hypothetical protein n=1 Tax=Streptomyces sp. 15-116A TaxID=2259035 RepID=UPI0021B1E135|nr:hypothetical protein [Streptomyces sp. 15-116A]MCT7356224.1 hypothetical protein [Streptomyces sp. 15-116A]
MPASETERRQGAAVFSLLALAVAGAALAFLTIWTTEALAPVTEKHAVIAHEGDGDEAFTEESDGPYDFEVHALTEDGDTIPLGEGGELLKPLALGDPVIVTLSNATGRPLGARGPGGEVSLHHHAGMIILVTLATVALLLTTRYHRRLRRATHAILTPLPPKLAPWITPAAVTATALATTTALLTPDTPDHEPHTMDGMGIYASADHFPDTSPSR